MAITALPTPPSRSDQSATFVSRSDAFISALPVFVTEANALQIDVNAKQALALISADNAASSEIAAALSAQSSSASAVAAAQVASAWISGTTYVIGDMRYSPVNFLSYRRKTAGAGVIDPSTDATNWEPMVGGKQLIRSVRTANALLAEADRGTLIDITSGTFSQTFAAAATLGSGWYCYIRNSGAGDITLDPNAAELIDGLSTFVMYPGECRLVQCTGISFTSIVLSPFYKTYVASGTFTKPPGYSSFAGIIWGAGGGGGRQVGNALYSGGGGGGGGAHLFNALSGVLGLTASVVIGAGGVALTANGTGNVGGASSFNGAITAYGGGGGGGGAMAYHYGGGGGGTTLYFGNSAYSAADGQTVNGVFEYQGGAGKYGYQCVYGGGGGGSGQSTVLQAGTSMYGGAGGIGIAAGAVAAGDGTAPGGGGGGAGNTSTGNSGAGARGELRIWGVA